MTSREWSVYVRLVSEVDPTELDHVRALETITSMLQVGHEAAVSAVNGDVTAHARAVADTAADALEQVRGALAVAASDAGLPIREVVEQRVRPWNEFVTEVDQATLPELVSGPEAAALLGVTRQRVHQLANEHPLFPDPAYELGVGRLWLRVQIDAFAKRWDRRPGRRPIGQPRDATVTPLRSTRLGPAGGRTGE